MILCVSLFCASSYISVRIALILARVNKVPALHKRYKLSLVHNSKTTQKKQLSVKKSFTCRVGLTHRYTEEARGSQFYTFRHMVGTRASKVLEIPQDRNYKNLVFWMRSTTRY